VGHIFVRTFKHRFNTVNFKRLTSGIGHSGKKNLELHQDLQYFKEVCLTL